MPDNTYSLFADHIISRTAALHEILEAQGYDELLIYSGTEITAFLDDYHYPFKANPHFMAWLPLTRHPRCWLQFRPGCKPVLYYHQPSDYWHAPPEDPADWWAAHFEIKTIDRAVSASQILLGRNSAMIGEIEDRRGAGDVSLNPGNLLQRLDLLRSRKTDWEIACIGEANRIAVRGHRAAHEAWLEGKSEFDIELDYLRAAGQQAHEMPYGSIVALNEHAATLHYQGKDTTAPANRYAFLIDAGATCHGYAADITRTYSHDTGLFADLLAAMDTIEQELAATAVSGVDYRQHHILTHRKIAGLLAESGILKVAPETALEAGITSTFLPHGLGHFLGLQTHDVAGLMGDEGEPIPRPEGHPFLRLTRTLEAGNVLTIEPGLYFIDSLLAELKAGPHADSVDWALIDRLRPYGGIRVEDNVVVADGGSRNLTRESFAGAG